MAITTYTELLTAVDNWTHRADLSARTPEFIALAEQRIYMGSKDPQFPSRPLRIKDMEEQDTGNASSGAIAYPTGYLSTIRLYITTNGVKRSLRYKSGFDLAEYESNSGNSVYYGRANGTLIVGPTTAAYTHDYYKRFDALTSGAPTNWLLTNAPGIYLYGVLVEAMPFMGKDAKLATWYRMFVASINSLQGMDDDAVRGKSGLAVTPG